MKFSKHTQLKKKTEKKKKLITYTKLLKKADDTFAAYIRKRDKHCYGIDLAEGYKCKGFLCNCHLFSRSKKDIRFDEQNCNAGCMYHNQIHDHTMRPQPHIYTGWFLKKYGVEAYQNLVKRANLTKKWTREELNGIIETYKLKLLQLNSKETIW